MEKKHHAHKHATKAPEAKPVSEQPKQKEFKITVPEIKGINTTTLTAVAAILLLLLVTFQAFQANSLSKKLDATAEKAKDASRPAAIEVTAIEADCTECTSLAAMMAQIQSAKVEITKSLSLPATDEHSRKLISDYSIKRLPAIVITGEVEKASLSGFTKVTDALVYQSLPPYYDIQSGSVKGIVSITFVNISSCKECPDLMPFVKQLSSQVKVGKTTIVDKDSPEGSKLVKEFSMSRLPGVLVSSDVLEYPIGAQLAQAGTLKKGGTIALGATAPYYNVSTGSVDGLAELTLLNDTSCNGCYPVTMHAAILRQGFGVYLKSVKTVDAATAEGKAIIAKYGIDAVPTFLLAGGISPYDGLKAVWPDVGTVEDDGTYILRKMGAIAGSPYKNLTTGKVEPNLPKQQQAQAAQ